MFDQDINNKKECYLNISPIKQSMNGNFSQSYFLIMLILIDAVAAS
jgi:hypothetical protein